MSRNSNILRNKDITIKGKISLGTSSKDNVIDLSEKIIQRYENMELKIAKAEEEYQIIIEKTKEDSEKILAEAKEKSETMERKAYESGYEQGIKNGYEDGYKESYETNIKKAKEESELIREKAYNTLRNINIEVSKYMKKNQENILNLSISIAEQVLREKFKDTEYMNMMIKNVINEYELKKDLIIKLNPIYMEELATSIDEMKKTLNLSQDIFLVGDESIEIGNAEIENDGGKLSIGIDSVLDRVKSELL